MSVRSLRGDEALPLAAAVWPCYDQVFGDSRRCLLGTTDDPDDPSVRLYLRAWWRTLGILEPGCR